MKEIIYQGVDLKALAIQLAKGNYIDETLFQAIIEVESAWQPYTLRFEPTYKYLLQHRDFASHLGVTNETEEVCQKTSWGLVQIMGGKAREFGFKALMPKLLEPGENLYYGCKLIQSLYTRYGHDHEADVIAAYNAGSALRTAGGMYMNQRYVDKVDQVLRRLRTAPV